MEIRNINKNKKSNPDLELFKNLSPRKIMVGFRTLSDLSDSESLLWGKILQLEDVTNPERKVIINFDSEGRLINIELGVESLDIKIRVFERSFDGRFYVYSENCKNLKLNKEDIYRYYDYYNEAIYEDLKISRFLIDSVNSVLGKIHKTGYKSTKKIILIDSESEKGLKKISPNIIKILDNAYKKYNWEGLLKEKILLQEVYPTSVSVLPPEVRPDQNPVFAVIQMTQGCRIKDLRGPCKFCSSYRNVCYKEKSIEELKRHISQVKKFTGKGWKYVKKIFLSDADPFYTDIDSEVYLKFLNKEISNAKWYESFISTPAILSKSDIKWRKLMKLGLKKLYWGVESADDKTLEILGKSHNKKALYKAASILNKIKIPYVVILLSGIGSLDNNSSHLKETADFIYNINCSDVYISRFSPQPGTEIFNLIKKGKLKFPSLSIRESEHRKMIKMLSYNKENPLVPLRNIKGTYGVQFNR